ncbi:MAG: cytochrome c [Verrucomicrobiota bacterium]|nr:cytochrome c [Verrucomicrobiota bacterium]
MAKGPDHIDYEETPDLTEVHAAIQREHRDPTAKVTPVPLWLTLLCGAAVCWAGAYVGVFHGGFDSSIYDEFQSSPIALFPPKTGLEKKETQTAVDDPIALGKEVYGVCQACHQPSGLGMPPAFPPLAGSEWVIGSEKRLAMIVLKGLQGPIKVGNTTFNGVMPPPGGLSDKKIAAVLTYVRQEWGNKAPPITPEQIKNARAEFAGIPGPVLVQDLERIPPDAKLEGGAPPAGAPSPASSSAAPAAAPPTAAAGSAPAPATTATAPAGAAPALPAASAPAPTPPAQGGSAVPPEQIAQGRAHYMITCVACHMPNGAGLPNMAPSLVKSDYVNGSPKRLVSMVLKGINPPFIYKGATYLIPMTAQELMLDDAKIAAILTFVRSSFENSAPPVSAEFVASVRKEFADRKTPWTQAELDNWKDDATSAQAAAR